MTLGFDNPFAAIGPPPAGNDPEEQLEYLRRVVGAFHATGHPRIKPLGRKLDAAIEKVATTGQRDPDQQKLAEAFDAEIRALRVQTFELLLTVVNQVRGTLRIKLKQGQPPAEKLDIEQLQKALGLFAQGMRKLVTAAKKGDAEAHAQGSRILDDAGAMMNETGHSIGGA